MIFVILQPINASSDMLEIVERLKVRLKFVASFL